MDKRQLQELLVQVSQGKVSPQEAVLQIRTQPYKDMGFAKLDTHRGVRQGASEVIYGAGKTREQILGIVQEMVREREKTVLITRMSREAADYVGEISWDGVESVTYKVMYLGTEGGKLEPGSSETRDSLISRAAGKAIPVLPYVLAVLVLLALVVLAAMLVRSRREVQALRDEDGEAPEEHDGNEEDESE